MTYCIRRPINSRKYQVLKLTFLWRLQHYFLWVFWFCHIRHYTMTLNFFVHKIQKTLKGAIVPKLEVSTKTSIEEILCDFSDVPQGTHVVNPRSLLTSQSSLKSSRPRKVCHSIGFSRYPTNAWTVHYILSRVYLFKFSEYKSIHLRNFQRTGQYLNTVNLLMI